MSTPDSVNRLQSAVALVGQFTDLSIQSANHLHGFLDGGSEFVRLALPSADTIHLRGSTAHLGVDLLTELAIGASRNCLHDEFHAACLADSVLLSAMLSEVAPLPIATSKTVLVVEAHVSDLKSYVD
jgi:hypothetical protein